MSAVLLVVGDKTALTSDDTLLQGRLTTTLGHTVTVVDDTDVESDTGMALVILTASVSANDLGTKYKTRPVPILALQGGSANVWPNLGLCTSTGGSNTSSSVSWLIVDTTGSTLTGGNSGVFTAWTSGNAGQRYTTNLIAGALRIANGSSSDNGRTVAFEALAGTTLTDGTSTAAGWRGGLDYVDGNLTNYVTAAWWNMFDAFVARGISQAPASAPTANAGPDQSVFGGGVVTLAGSASGGSGSGYTYAWTQVSGPTITLSSATAAAPTFLAPTAGGTVVLALVVTDGASTSSAADSVTITSSARTLSTPTADILTTGWTTSDASANFYAVLAELTDTDGKYAQSPASPSASSLEVKCPIPASTATDGHTIYVEASVDAAAAGSTLVVEVREGTTVRATRTFTDQLTTTRKRFEVKLTSGEIAAIVDRTNVRIRTTVTAA